MPEIKTTAQIIALQQQWKDAKKVEKDWNAHRLQIENSILEALQHEGFDLPETGTVTMEELAMTFSKTRKWQQTLLGDFLSRHKEMLGQMFKWEYKPVNNRDVNNLIATGSDLGRELLACFTDTQNKTSFKIR